MAGGCEISYRRGTFESLICTSTKKEIFFRCSLRRSARSLSGPGGIVKNDLGVSWFVYECEVHKRGRGATVLLQAVCWYYCRKAARDEKLPDTAVLLCASELDRDGTPPRGASKLRVIVDRKQQPKNITLLGHVLWQKQQHLTQRLRKNRNRNNKNKKWRLLGANLLSSE